MYLSRRYLSLNPRGDNRLILKIGRMREKALKTARGAAVNSPVKH